MPEETEFQTTIKWFDPRKGFGFAESDRGDVFVHYKSIEAAGFRQVVEKQRVVIVIDQVHLAETGKLRASRCIPMES